MQVRGCLLVALVAASLALPCSAFAGAPSPGVRKAGLSCVCKGGQNAGRSCTSGSQCAGSKCGIDYIPGTALPGTMTLIIDDNVNSFGMTEGASSIRATTVMLELDVAGETKILAQTYQSVYFGQLAVHEVFRDLALWPHLHDSFSGVSEFGVEVTFDGNNVPNDFTLQSPDDQIAEKIRDALGQSSGTPVLRSVGSPMVVRHSEDQTATVLRMSVTVQLVDD